MCRESMSEWLDHLEDCGAWSPERLDFDPPGLSYAGKHLIEFIKRHLNEETP